MTQPDPRLEPIRAAIDSTLMLVLARFFMPGVVGVLGWLLTGVLGDLKSANERVQVQISRLVDQQSNSGVAIATVSTKLDDNQRQLDRLQIQVDNLPKHN